MGVVTKVLSLALLAVLLGIAAWAGVRTWATLTAGLSEREVLREVYSPTFGKMPSPAPASEVVRQLQTDLRAAAREPFFRGGLPTQSGALLLSLVLLLVVAFDFERPASARNLVLLTSQALGFLFFDILRFLDVLGRAASVTLMDWVFRGIVFFSLVLIYFALRYSLRPLPNRWRPSIGGRTLATIAVVLVALDCSAAVLRAPDDAGYFINLGGQRLRERHLLPYGDPLLTGTPAGGYGPLLYAAHVPFQLIFDPSPANAVSSPSPPLGRDSTYVLPPAAATKLCTIAFQLIAVLALFRIGRTLGDRDVGWALVALYAGSAYVLGVGGADYFIGGMTFVSHIAPAAATLVAFAALGRPALAAALLVAAGGFGFYPAFLAPAWLGFYWDRPADRRRFLISLVVCAAILGTAILLLSRPAGGRGLVGTILWDTFGHHTDPAGYGSSPFSFWGQRGGIRGWLMTPVVGGSGFTSPAFLSFLALACAGFLIARRRSARSLALVSAAIVIASALLKVHPTGTYVAWYYPLLLIGFLTPEPASSASGSSVKMTGSS